MAETTGHLNQRNLTVTVKDGTGTPKTYVVRVPSEGIALTPAQFEAVRARDTDSSYIGPPRKGPLTESAMLKLTNIRIHDLGDNTTEAVIADFVGQAGGPEGYVASTWTSTDTTGVDYRLYDIPVAMSDHGTTKGGTWLYEDAFIANQPTVTITPEGVFIDELIFKVNSGPTLTRNS
jgi:hypothetical protein